MRIVQSSAGVIARFLISAIFLTGAISKIIHWHETEAAVMAVLSDWQSYLHSTEAIRDFFTALIPWTSLLVILAILLELVGGLMVLLGVKEKLGAALLILFLLPATILMHQFWFGDTIGREMQTTMFLKNCSILGGLILILLQDRVSLIRD